MATTYTHTRLSIVDAAGNVNILYPSTTGADVTISQANNSILTTKGITTVQGLADALKAYAFSDTVNASALIDDTAGNGTTNKTWSADKIYDELAQISGNMPSAVTVDNALSSSSENPVQNKVIKSALDTMSTNFQAGCDSIVQAVTAKGSTPASNSPSDIVSAIGNLDTSGGDTDHGAITISEFNSMTDAQLLALSSGKTYYGTDIDSTDTTNRNVTSNGIQYAFSFSLTDKYTCYINKYSVSEIVTKSTITFDELTSVLDYSDRSVMVGKLVTGLTNSLYNRSYRIIGYDHDGSSNTYDLITEDCVQKASSGFGSSNRHYNDSGCYARIFAEETFYNAFSSDVKSYIQPMEVKYYYKSSTGITGGTLQTTTAYGKLLSYNEAGTIYASTTSQGDKYEYCQNDGAEGNVYPYYNLTGSTLSNIRIKKYNGSAVRWWLRSRDTGSTNGAGRIYTNGDAIGNDYYYTGYYLAPVLRIG